MTRQPGAGSWVVLTVLVLLLVLAIVFLVVGWETTAVDSRQSMSTGGYVAMVLGIVATLAMGVGLMALVFYSSRKGSD